MSRCILIAGFLFFISPMAYAHHAGGDLFGFHIREGFIVTTARVGAVEGLFILDTGAPDLVLNSRHFSSRPVQESGMGVSGEVPMEVSLIESFSWAHGTLGKTEVYATDLFHLEQVLGAEVLGLIGTRLFENKGLFIDYASEKISVLSSKEIKKLQDADIVVTMLDLNGLPGMEFSMGGKHFLFGIDSGALSNFVDAEAGKEILNDQSQTEHLYRVRGLNADTQRTYSYSWDHVKIGGRTIAVDMDFLALCLKEHDPAGRIEGILGVPFLKQGALLLDFQSREVRLWPPSLAIN